MKIKKEDNLAHINSLIEKHKIALKKFMLFNLFYI